jgi:hypothetical protein
VGDLLEKFGVTESSECHVSDRVWKKKAAAGKRRSGMVEVNEAKEKAPKEKAPKEKAPKKKTPKKKARLREVANEEGEGADSKPRMMASVLLETMELGFVSLLQFVRVYASGLVTKRSMEEAARRGCGVVLPAGAQGADLAIPEFKFERGDLHRVNGRQRVRPEVKVTMEHMTTMLVVQVNNSPKAPISPDVKCPQNLGPNLSSSRVWEMSPCPELQAMACVGMLMSIRSGATRDSFVAVGGDDRCDGSISYANVIVGKKALRSALGQELYRAMSPLMCRQKVEPEREAVSVSMPEFVSQYARASNATISATSGDNGDDDGDDDDNDDDDENICVVHEMVDAE